MKMKTGSFITVLLLAGLSATARADDSRVTRRDSKEVFDKSILSERMPAHEESNEVFKANEWQIDVFGTYADVTGGHTYKDGFGGGVGANYFWTRNWGAGLEGYWWEGAHNDVVLHNVGANLFYRYPIDEINLAPYAFIGPGGHIDGSAQASGHAGLGAEWRFMEHFGLFADARYTITTSSSDFILYRAGLRYSF